MIVYRDFSFYEMAKSIVFRLILLAFIVYLDYHYTENKTLISILFIISLTFLFLIGNDLFVVTPDKLVVKNNSLFCLFFHRKKEYLLSEVQSAFLLERQKSEQSEVAVALILLAVFPSQRHRVPEISTPIFIKYRDGQTIQIKTDLSERKASKLVDAINSEI